MNLEGFEAKDGYVQGSLQIAGVPVRLVVQDNQNASVFLPDDGEIKVNRVPVRGRVDLTVKPARNPHLRAPEGSWRVEHSNLYRGGEGGWALGELSWNATDKARALALAAFVALVAAEPTLLLWAEHERAKRLRAEHQDRLEALLKDVETATEALSNASAYVRTTETLLAEAREREVTNA